MKVALFSANLGSFDKPVEHAKQELPEGVELTSHRFSDKDIPPRFNAMTPRLQARIVKMFGWQMLPGHDYYIWVDSSCALAQPDSLKWFLEQCKDVDIAVFKHPHRSTVQEEADYLKERLVLEREGKKQKYILPRYENELIDEQLAEVDPEAQLFASTAFIYKDSPVVRKAMKEWFYHTSRYHIIDQLGLPQAIKNLKVRVIPENYLKVPYLQYVRNK